MKNINRQEYQDYASLFPYRNLNENEREQIISVLQNQNPKINQQVVYDVAKQIFTSLDDYMDKEGNMLDEEEEFIHKETLGIREKVLAILKEDPETLKLIAGSQEEFSVDSKNGSLQSGYDFSNSLAGHLAREGRVASSDSGASGFYEETKGEVLFSGSADDNNKAKPLNQSLSNFDSVGFLKVVSEISALDNEEQLQIFQQMQIPEFFGIEKNHNPESYAKENVVVDLHSICTTLDLKNTSFVDSLFKNEKSQLAQQPSSQPFPKGFSSALDKDTSKGRE